MGKGNKQLVGKDPSRSFSRCNLLPLIIRLISGNIYVSLPLAVKNKIHSSFGEKR